MSTPCTWNSTPEELVGRAAPPEPALKPSHSAATGPERPAPSAVAKVCSPWPGQVHPWCRAPLFGTERRLDTGIVRAIRGDEHGTKRPGVTIAREGGRC